MYRSILAAISIVSATQAAKTKTYREESPFVKANSKKMRAPLVTDTGRWCWFENDDDNWCWATTPPILNMGWENLQELVDFTDEDVDSEDYVPVKYYEWRLNFYAESQFYIQSQFYLSKLYYNEFSAYVPKFKSSAWTSLIVNGDFEICPGIGYNWEAVEALINMSMKFNDCYKNILSDVCEFNSDWKGYNSKYLDECDLSNDSLIELIDWDILDMKSDIPTLGTTDATSTSFCYAIPLISVDRTYSGINPENIFAQMAMSRFREYLKI